MTTKLKELGEQLDAKQKSLHEVFVQAGTELDMSKVTVFGEGLKSEEIVVKMRELDKEINDLTDQYKALETVEKAAERSKERDDWLGEKAGEHVHPSAGTAKDQPPGEQKTAGKLFSESPALKEYQRGSSQGPVATLDIEMKTLFERTAGWSPFQQRTGLVVPYATRPIQIMDLIPSGPISGSGSKYMEETTFTQNAAERAEGGAYGESAFALTERTITVETIGHWLPVTDEQLEDVAQVEAYVDNRLRFGLMQRLDSQILNGSGSTPQLVGLLNKSGIQTFVRAGDPFDTIYDAIKRVRVTGRAVPNAVILHPNDWQELRLMRTDDGLYILGNPDMAGPMRVWGLPVAEADAIAEGSVATGDFANFSQLLERRGVEVQVTNSHDTYFISGKQAIRASVRGAVVWYRPAAFCVITSF